jgi:hypothetical protein
MRSVQYLCKQLCLPTTPVSVDPSTTCNTVPTVPEVIIVPVSSGKVSVRLVLLLGLAMVNMPVPEASGASEIFDII